MQDAATHAAGLLSELCGPSTSRCMMRAMTQQKAGSALKTADHRMATAARLKIL